MCTQNIIIYKQSLNQICSDVYITNKIHTKYSRFTVLLNKTFLADTIEVKINLEEDKKVCLIRGEAETEVLALKLENICILIIRFVINSECQQ